MKKTNKMKIYNAFGICPTSNCTAAGLDFYVPKFNGIELIDTVMPAWEKSYKKTRQELEDILNTLISAVTREYGEEFVEGNELNILQLFLCLGVYVGTEEEYAVFDAVEYFVENYLRFDSNKVPGINLFENDHIFVNSGIKVNLDKDTAGIFFNKSGRGNKGFDVRACVVDEDYAGFVHLSLAYTKNNANDGLFYCGDKITQMVILPIIHKECEEVSEEEYNKLMDGTLRGDSGFGSSDVKH